MIALIFEDSEDAVIQNIISIVNTMASYGSIGYLKKAGIYRLTEKKAVLAWS